MSSDFASGGLNRTSYVRPGKLFTANDSLIDRAVGVLSPPTIGQITSAVIQLISGNG